VVFLRFRLRSTFPRQLLMERFISRERNEPPDIDIDFEHERRGR
jgi:DNA polymerase III alpha subunit